MWIVGNGGEKKTKWLQHVSWKFTCGALEVPPPVGREADGQSEPSNDTQD